MKDKKSGLTLLILAAVQLILVGCGEAKTAREIFNENPWRDATHGEHVACLYLPKNGVGAQRIVDYHQKEGDLCPPIVTSAEGSTYNFAKEARR